MREAQTIIKRPLLTEKSARLRETGGAASARAEGEEYAQKVVFEVALAIQKQVPLWVEDLSKAQRGYLLCSGETSPPRMAQPVGLAPLTGAWMPPSQSRSHLLFSLVGYSRNVKPTD